MSKKCKLCCEDAMWKWEGNYYCQFCLCTEFDVWQQDAPCACEMCGAHLDRVYYTDSEGFPFCSAECALKYNDACEIEESEANGDDEATS